jgi:hypothetical protein
MTFNPANFAACTTHAQVNSTLAAAVEAQKAVALKVQALEQAAARFALRRDSFAIGKQHTCLDMAARLDKFKAFASDKQAAFADKLIEWSQPKPYSAVIEATVPPPSATTLPKLHALMQRLAKLTIGNLTIARKNQDSLCWVKWDNCPGVVGKIENGTLTLFAGRLVGVSLDTVLADLQRIEADPEAAAVLHGRASGCCSVCSRDLTDPESIARGIGPICAEKF